MGERNTGMHRTRRILLPALVLALAGAPAHAEREIMTMDCQGQVHVLTELATTGCAFELKSKKSDMPLGLGMAMKTCPNKPDMTWPRRSASAPPDVFWR